NAHQEEYEAGDFDPFLLENSDTKSPLNLLLAHNSLSIKKNIFSTIENIHAFVGHTHGFEAPTFPFVNKLVASVLMSVLDRGSYYDLDFLEKGIYALGTTAYMQVNAGVGTKILRLCDNDPEVVVTTFQ
ncbi:hypothetical protein HC823_02100, partial [Candidatus Gracilibacteria bacterium]|nr:hypothetical protein [Candidatus Gracilibacteria bacterium]